MTREPRVVIDTNVLVSFFLHQGSTPWRAVRDVLEYGEMLDSDDTLAELAEVLRRPKFDRYVSRALRDEFLGTLPEFATDVEIVERIKACLDPRDDKFLEAAVNGQADFLVTGDRALSAMKSFRSVVIVNPSGYLRIARGQPGDRSPR
jgi:putative PIN family toxin of toxin-antitoxin system